MYFTFGKMAFVRKTSIAGAFIGVFLTSWSSTALSQSKHEIGDTVKIRRINDGICPSGWSYRIKDSIGYKQITRYDDSTWMTCQLSEKMKANRCDCFYTTGAIRSTFHYHKNGRPKSELEYYLDGMLYRKNRYGRNRQLYGEQRYFHMDGSLMARIEHDDHGYAKILEMRDKRGKKLNPKSPFGEDGKLMVWHMQWALFKLKWKHQGKWKAIDVNLAK